MIDQTIIFHADIPCQYLGECYKRRLYNECLFVCNQLLETNSTAHSMNKDEVLLLKGKSLFRIYMAELTFLKQQRHNLQEKDYRIRRSNCFDKARQVIEILGSLYDSSLHESDGDVCKFLDLSMINYAYEFNDLQICKRCLLCRRKVAKLHRSHIWPQGILADFNSGVEVPKSKKSLLISWQSQDCYWSPKEVTFFLFCSSCEKLLSAHGETQFIPLFFRKVYDPSRGTKCARVIEYGKWLYEFCVGVIFRGLCQPNMTKFVNCDEIYCLLTLCRDILLSISQVGDKIMCCKPDVFIFIGPTESDENIDFINRTLNMSAFYGVEDIDLSNGKVVCPRSAQFFLAHFGIINIVAHFKGSCYAFKEENQISLEGGTFSVPENSQRQSLLPVGLWVLFVQLARDFEVNWLTRSSKAIDNYANPEKKQPDKTKEELFGQVGATKKDFDAMQREIQLSISLPKLISFLPKEFTVFHSDKQSVVEVPDGHSLLIHYIIMYNDIQETLFLCIGNRGHYTLQKPYVIYHYSKSGLQLSTGFFISPNDLTAQDFLPGTKNLQQLADVEPVSFFRQNIHRLLPSILEEKGFFTIQSLLCRIHER